MDEKEKILVLAQEHFFREGFYKTTMDALACKLHISKKTIYKHFSSKEELLKEGSFNYFGQQKNRIEKIISSEITSIEKFYKLFTSIGEFTLQISDKFISDMLTYTPEIWSQIDEFRAKLMTKNITKIFEQGKKEGMIIDIPSVIVVNMLISSVRGITNGTFLINNNFNLKFAIQKTIEVVLRGIMTPEGGEIFNKLRSNQSL